MFTTAITRQRRLLAALLFPAAIAACDAGSAVRPDAARTTAGARALVAPLRDVTLGSCSNLAVSLPERVSAHLYAIGTQNYMWTGSAWLFVGPEADLFADAGGHGKVGIHYAGPTWLSNSGSGVVGIVADRCTPDANAIPWLLLSAVSSRGPGLFEGTTHIQRVNTVGGLMPSTPGTTYGEKVKVPYTAEYVFYR